MQVTSKNVSTPRTLPKKCFVKVPKNYIVGPWATVKMGLNSALKHCQQQLQKRQRRPRHPCKNGLKINVLGGVFSSFRSRSDVSEKTSSSTPLWKLPKHKLGVRHVLVAVISSESKELVHGVGPPQLATACLDEPSRQRQVQFI